MLVHRTILTPLGAMRLVATPVALVEAEFASGAPPTPCHRSDVLDEAEQELRSYFAGTLRSFSTPLSFAGTDFQRAVWRALTRIRYGQRVSYRTLAERVGRPKAVRAVGSANGKNRLAIFVPCHRVIASSGELAGYAGGTDKKRWLLDHEIEPSVGRGPTGNMTRTTGPEPD
jgi:methylated-DNA-[protein]-cysteine S-methyltransferase